MPHGDVGTTNTAQLRAIVDWRDHDAWAEFQERYDPLLRHCCASLGLDVKGDDAEEVCQETWIAVAVRMQSFVYDPGRGTFRGWLWRVCYHEALDLFERRRKTHTFRLDERDEAEAGAPDIDDERPTALDARFQQAEEIQAEVRRRVAPHTWEAFWLVAVVFWTVEDAARHLGMSEAAVYKAKTRVTAMLQEEARRRRLAAMDLGLSD